MHTWKVGGPGRDLVGLTSITPFDMNVCYHAISRCILFSFMDGLGKLWLSSWPLISIDLISEMNHTQKSHTPLFSCVQICTIPCDFYPWHLLGKGILFLVRP